MTTDDTIAKQPDAGSLAPEPAVLTGARIGYARVSTSRPTRSFQRKTNDSSQPLVLVVRFWRAFGGSRSLPVVRWRLI